MTAKLAKAYLICLGAAQIVVALWFRFDPSLEPWWTEPFGIKIFEWASVVTLPFFALTCEKIIEKLVLSAVLIANCGAEWVRIRYFDPSFPLPNWYFELEISLGLLGLVAALFIGTTLESAKSE